MGRVTGLAAGSAVVLAALFAGSGTAVAAPAGPVVAGPVETRQDAGCDDAAAGTDSGGSGSSTAAGPLDMLCRLITDGGAAASGGSAGGGTGGGATSGTSGVAGSTGSSGGGASGSAASGGATTGGGTAATGTSATTPAPGSPGAAAPPAGGVLSSILAFLAGCLQAVGL